ncbi:MAG: hypothetical protein JJU29_19670 [Verrucomicrobia bacterium]|nr:hypothetical protein [Verrucomicrobiota bacterium]MCH8512349.1 hypothetical protein [Kiritimatiellia bacterium]
MTPTGPWKEGREGAASLCYIDLQPEELDHVLRHHAAVGIRASLVCNDLHPNLSLPAERNWDLVAGREDPDLLSGLQKLDGCPERGCFLPTDSLSDPARFLYRLGTSDGVIPSPGPDLSAPLPSRKAPADTDMLLNGIEADVGKAHWGVWRIDSAILAEMGVTAHERLLQKLGDHHARIWCAPIRDIAGWQPADASL